MSKFTQQELEGFQKSFAQDGYVVFRGLVPKETVARLTADILGEYERVRQQGELFAGGGAISGHLNCFPGEGSRQLYAAIEERGLLDVVRAVYPKPWDRPFVGCNLNLPGSVAQHYHMDGNYQGDFLILNVAAIDTDLVNGAIDVLPGTHQKFYPYWQFALEGAAKRTTRLQMKQGDVLLRVSTLWHRGMPNHSSNPRPMIAFTIGDPGTVPPPDPFQAHGGKITFLPNWYRPTLLGRLRERTFVAVPASYSAYRIVRSVFGKKGYAS